MKLFGKALACVLSASMTGISAAFAQTDSDVISKIVKIQGPEGKPGTGFVLGPDKRRRCLLLTAKHTMFN